MVLDHKLSDHQYVKLAGADLDGILRGKYVSAAKAKSIIKKGLGFCSVIFAWDCEDKCYEVPFSGWHTGYQDLLAKIDPNTLRHVPWDNNIPFFLFDFWQNPNESASVCPRGLLRKQIESLSYHNLSAKIGFEFEWFNFKESPESLREKNYQGLNNLTPGMCGYSLLRMGEQQKFIQDLLKSLRDFKIPVEAFHTETGPGVYEACLEPESALAAADQAILFKASVKEIARRHDIVSTFMSRWNNSLPGSSGHIHISLNGKNGENAFYDESDPQKMSPTLKSFLAGLLELLPEMMPMLAPNVNSYKRLVEGFWAPTCANWSIDNRTCALRIINSEKNSTRIEVRVGGADLNPYLALSAIMAAGLYGVQSNKKLTQAPVKGNGYEDKSSVKLPANLHQATTQFMNSSKVNELLGQDFVQHYAIAKNHESTEHHNYISDWELKRYFELT
jgi:glutamine synthetase